ncbi:hypothetical protein [Aminobacter sp. AP02]|uniref:hypothetical protein n=1 Tax=Aminobacter sp. AP02 TaxID=2135737 RepID=UPI0011B234A2|nr:hypothetical protein [Aminobacter sp. AP02]
MVPSYMGREAAPVHCVACNALVGVRAPSAGVTPAFVCQCGQSVSDDHALYACVRVEMAQLAATLGRLLNMLIAGDEARRDQLARHADAMHLEIEGGPAVGALVASMMMST